MTIRTHTELQGFSTFADRFRYLALHGRVGEATFGFDRWMNQQFYRSRAWRRLRNEVLIRDEGCDLGIPGYEIYDRPIIHHINPLTVDDVATGSDDALNPEFLITVTLRTHNAIHYGDESLLAVPLVPRRPGDTQLWTRRS